MFNFLFSILFLPLVMIVDVFRSKRSGGKKILYLIFILVFFGGPWFLGYQRIYTSGQYLLYHWGVIDRLTSVKVSGESMLPTIEDGTTLELHSPRKYPVNRGDIISFSNVETGGVNYLKRVVGLPGEEFLIKNGYVLINGRILDEDYVLNQSLTYGNEFLIDCDNYQIPEDHYLVLGDNRAVSVDSRVLGFVNQDDVNGVINMFLEESFLEDSIQKQKFQVKLTAEQIFEQINHLRRNHNSAELKLNQDLSRVAEKRVQLISENKSDLPLLEKSLDEDGYGYLTSYELTAFGNLDAALIVKQIIEDKLNETALLSEDYYEVGIGLASRENKECRVPVISVILSAPSSYPDELVDLWKEEVTYLKEGLAYYNSIRGRPDVSQEGITEKTNLLNQMLVIAEEIKQRLEKGQFVSEVDFSEYNSLKEKLLEEEPS